MDIQEEQEKRLRYERRDIGRELRERYPLDTRDAYDDRMGRATPLGVRSRAPSPERREPTRPPRRKLPSGLPRFRGSKGLKDPNEFLSEFYRICRASGVFEEHMAEVLSTCLEQVDSEWLET